MAQVKFDASDLNSFAKAVRQADKNTAKEYRKALLESAAIVAEEARHMMEGYSPKVAKTIKPFAVGAAAGVQTGKKGPVGGFAVALEVGNASDDRAILESRRSGMFKHKVFGKWTSPAVEQGMFPTLGPAALAKDAEMIEALRKGVVRAFKDVKLDIT